MLRLNRWRPVKKVSSLKNRGGFSSLCKVRVARAFIAHERPPGSPLTNKGKSPNEVATIAAVPGGRAGI
jgi:hypothetical protein